MIILKVYNCTLAQKHVNVPSEATLKFVNSLFNIANPLTVKDQRATLASILFTKSVHITMKSTRSITGWYVKVDRMNNTSLILVPLEYRLNVRSGIR